MRTWVCLVLVGCGGGPGTFTYNYQNLSGAALQIERQNVTLGNPALTEDVDAQEGSGAPNFRETDGDFDDQIVFTPIRAGVRGTAITCVVSQSMSDEREQSGLVTVTASALACAHCWQQQDSISPCTDPPPP